MKQENKENKTFNGIKKAISVPFNGYKALFAMANGDMDEAYRLTHSESEVNNKLRLKTPQGKNVSVQSDTFKCPGCSKKLNERVSKCTCGMEFK